MLRKFRLDDVVMVLAESLGGLFLDDHGPIFPRLTWQTDHGCSILTQIMFLPHHVLAARPRHSVRILFSWQRARAQPSHVDPYGHKTIETWSSPIVTMGSHCADRYAHCRRS